MSSTWTTVYSNPGELGFYGMASDGFGNVYAVAVAPNSNATLDKETAGQWSTLLVQPGSRFRSVATDPAGNVFIAGDRVVGDGSRRWSIWELPIGQNALSLVDDMGGGGYPLSIATDGGGNVYATGDEYVTTSVHNKATTTQFSIVRELTPANGGFSASDVYQSTAVLLAGSGYANIDVIDSAATAGIYVTGLDAPTGSYGDVLKSTDGGTHWSIVDHFANWNPFAVTGDGRGNVFVTGQESQQVITGYSKGKPVYRTVDHWLVRQSAGGNSGTWTTTDDFLPPPGYSYQITPQAIGADPAGNVYVVGWDGAEHAMIRTNSGGSWSTVDDYSGADGSGAQYTAFAVDTSGNLYAAGGSNLGSFARSAPPASMPAGPAAVEAVFSSTRISGTTDSIRIFHHRKRRSSAAGQ